MSLEPGTRTGPFEVLALLGAGGMGEVYRARDPRLGRDVEEKVLPEGFFESEERRRRFEREAKLLASLSHPNIAAIYSFEEIPSSSSSTRHLLVMELVEGEGFDEKIASGPLPLEESLSYAEQIAEALEDLAGRRDRARLDAGRTRGRLPEPRGGQTDAPRNYDVTRGGKEFVAIRPERPEKKENRLAIVTRWTAGLEQSSRK